MRARSGLFLTCLATAALDVPGVPAQEAERSPSYSVYGTPGLIDMPTAQTAPDAELATTIGWYPGDLRTTLTFQALPRLSGTFRYAGLDGDIIGTGDRALGLTYDRSFDVRLTVLKEGVLTPSVVVGLQDLAGTGLVSAEYVVASKRLTRTVLLTGGLGWGRFGTDNTLGSLGSRDEQTEGEGGIPSTGAWFRGDFAPFAGLSIQTGPRTTLKFEYSSDAYVDAVRNDVYDRRTPFNAAIEYRLDDGTQLSVFAIHGSEIGVQASFPINPKEPQLPGGREEAPLPIPVRPEGAAADTTWAVAPQPGVEAALRAALRRDRLFVEGLDLQARSATLRFRNVRFGAPAQAIGRAARAMARTLPASVEVFRIIPVEDGMSLSEVVVRRSDLEAFEFAEPEAIRPLVGIRDAFAAPQPVRENLYPRYTFALEPYLEAGYFDPDVPIRVDLGVRLRGTVRPTPGLKFYGAITDRLVGNLDETLADTSGDLPPVRTNFPEYLREGYPGLERLTAAAFGRPGRDIYSRLTFGILEEQYGGLSGELLWKPVDSRLGLGLEVNRVRQRTVERRFEFIDYEVTTAFLSGYYQFEQGFYGQVDVGQYLARDRGATFTLMRTFANGWQVGAFATLTDATPEEFGEGSFDKGVLLSIPTSWILGTPDRSSINVNLRPILRNGGARLDVQDRLYGAVQEYHQPPIDRSFGRFWR